MREATFKTEYKVLPDLLVSIRNSLVGERYKLSITETGKPGSGVSLEFSSREEVSGFGKTISESLVKEGEGKKVWKGCWLNRGSWTIGSGRIGG